MPPSIGSVTQRDHGSALMQRSRARAELIPDLLIDAQRVANNVFAGWHGRRKRGIGENFWQFRPYSVGENMASIDWRRSARDDQIYVKDREWQAAHTVWLWVDESPSMLFKSDVATVAKQSRAMVLAFATAELLARSGERVGWVDVSPPIVSRNAAERLAEALMLSETETRFPESATLGRYTDLVMFSDFLDPIDETIEKMRRLARQGARGHMVHIIDPVEEVFPYSGRVEFIDPETREQFTAGNASTLKNEYEAMFAAREEALRTAATALGWSFSVHHTDRLASEALLSLHAHLSGQPIAAPSAKGS